jgi:hypothetical protein
LFFKALYEQKILMSVQTPFEFMSSMAIESIIAMQPEESNTISHFTMVLKEVRFASTLAATTRPLQGPALSDGTTPGTYPAPALQGRASLQATAPVIVGNVSGNDPASILSDPRNAADPVMKAWLNRPVNNPVGQ